MTTNHDSQSGIPELFRTAVSGLAAGLGVESEALFEGSALELDRRNFWFMHYGDLDKTGITILADVGEPPADRNAQIALTTPLLEYHLAFPVATHGYYGYLPQLNRLVHCSRIPLDEVEDSPSAILEVMMKVNSGMRRVDAELESDAHVPTEKSSLSAVESARGAS